MPKPRRHLEHLDAELLALGLDAMLVEELDGFVTGLLVCPDLIKPGEWLPSVWNAAGDEPSPFADLAHANRVFALIMEHYNSVAVTLFEHPERYRPLLPVDTNSAEIVWEVWIEGFEAALALRPEAWRPLLEADGATVEAFGALTALVDIARAGSAIPLAELEAIAATASDDITRSIIALNRWRLDNYSAPRDIEWGPPPAARKVGRNDPCPCGSGKKYKRCCGLN
jgi:uncharacterized protein